jgi:lauroyl/myristoyl acyltransferase
MSNETQLKSRTNSTVVARSTNLGAARLRACLRDLTVEPEEFRSLLENAQVEELCSFGWDWYYLNLLSALSRTMSPSNIKDIASACNRLKLWGGWEHCRFLLKRKTSRRDKEHVTPVLKGWNSELLETLRSAHAGIVICTAHFGASRYVTWDLAALGYTVTLALDSESYGQIRRVLSATCSIGPTCTDWIPFGRGRVRLLDVEADIMASTRAVSALRRNEIVVFFFDGNTGFDGPLGKANRCSLVFLGHEVSVKSGIAHIARVTGAPLVSAIAERDGECFGRVHLGVPVCKEEQDLNPSGLSEIVKPLYEDLEWHVQRLPEQWEGACLFHRWRRPRPTPPSSRLDTDPFFDLDRNEVVFSLNPSRYVLVRTVTGPALVDSEDLRCFPVDPEAETTVSALLEPGGLGCPWGETCKPTDSDNAVYRTVEALWKAGLADKISRDTHKFDRNDPDVVLKSPHPIGGVPVRIPS